MQGVTDTRFYYRCNRDPKHEILEARRTYDQCPVVVHGSPCNGTLTQFGPGSRKAK